MRTISLRQFRDSIADQAEPVIVQRRDKAGNFQILGMWTPNPPEASWAIPPAVIPLIEERIRGFTPAPKPSRRK